MKESSSYRATCSAPPLPGPAPHRLTRLDGNHQHRIMYAQNTSRGALKYSSGSTYLIAAMRFRLVHHG